MSKANPHKSALMPDIEDRLNAQVALEGISSAHYLAMASWSDHRGYKGAASFLYDHAEEEREHMLKLFRYINDVGGHAFHPSITDIQHDFSSLREIFEIVLAHEVKVSQAIHRLVEYCWAHKDVATFNFMQWYVTEQIEEEVTARKNLELFDVIGESGVGLHMIDKEIGAFEKEDKS